MCVFPHDPADQAHTYKVTYFKSVAGGHAASPTWSGWTTCSSSPRSASTLWRFDINLARKADCIGPHQLKLPQAMTRTASGRYVV